MFNEFKGDHEIGADEYEDYVEFLRMQAEEQGVDFGIDDDSLEDPDYDQSDEELDTLMAEWEGDSDLEDEAT